MVQGFTYWDNPNYPELDIKDFENEKDFDVVNKKALDEIVDYCIEHKIYIIISHFFKTIHIDSDIKTSSHEVYKFIFPI